MKLLLIAGGMATVILAFLEAVHPEGRYGEWATFSAAIVAFTELTRRLKDQEPEEVISQQQQQALAIAGLPADFTHVQRAIGTIAVIFPFATVLLAGGHIERSLSAYYYTSARDVYVGSLCAIGVLLLIHPGRSRSQFFTGAIAGFCCLIVALVPAAGGRRHSG